jgi:hypothetical protein
MAQPGDLHALHVPVGDVERGLAGLQVGDGLVGEVGCACGGLECEHYNHNIEEQKDGEIESSKIWMI